MLLILAVLLLLLPQSFTRCPQNCQSGCSQLDQAAGYTCSSCSAGTYLNGNLCIPCPPDCSDCTSASTCTDCFHSLALQTQAPNATGLCLACAINCETCTQVPTKCASCYSPYVLNTTSYKCELIVGIDSGQCLAPVILDTRDYSIKLVVSPFTINYCFSGYSEFYSWMNKFYGCPGAGIECIFNVSLYFEQYVLSSTNGIWANITQINDTAGNAAMTYWHKESWLEFALLAKKLQATPTKIDLLAKQLFFIVPGVPGPFVFNLTARLTDQQRVHLVNNIGATVTNLTLQQVNTMLIAQIHKHIFMIDCIQGYQLDNDNWGICVKCPSKCKICDQFGQCLQCYPPFVKSGLVCAPCHQSCQTCSIANSANNCTSCYAPFFLASNNRCITCAPQCQTCTDSGFNCIKCIRPFSLYANAFGGCYRCLQQSCLDCLSTNNASCRLCVSSFTLNLTACIRCPAQCSSCQTNGTALICRDCNSGFVLINNVCIACPADCLKCSQANPSICLQCSAAFQIDPQTNQCTNCMAGCSQCIINHVCVMWRQGFVMIDGQLVQCSKQFCSRCDQSQMCLECLTGHYLDPDAGSCGKCGLLCKQCNSTQCLVCEPNSLVGTGANLGRCVQCNPNCLTCSPANTTVCLSCVKGRYLNNTSCLTCSLFCSACLSQTRCIQCQSGFVLNTAGTCTKCTSTCYGLCDSQDVNICYQCSPAFVLVDNKCISCAAGCTLCQSMLCKRCATGLSLLVSVQGNATLSAVCMPICIFPCEKCRDNVCTLCTSGYQLLVNGTCRINLTCSGVNCTCPEASTYRQIVGTPSTYRCQLCPPGCRVCYGAGSGPSYLTICQRCAPGFFQSLTIINQCDRCANNCLICLSLNDCQICAPSYTIPIGSQTCQKCQGGCATCYGQVNSCLTCLPDFELINDRCIGNYRLEFNLVFVDQLTDFMENNRLVGVLSALARTTRVSVKDIILYSVKSGSSLVRGAISAGSRAQASLMTTLLVAAFAQSPDFLGSTLLSVSTFTIAFKQIVQTIIQAFTYKFEPGETLQRPQRLIIGWVVSLCGLFAVFAAMLYCIFKKRKVNLIEYAVMAKEGEAQAEGKNHQVRNEGRHQGSYQNVYSNKYLEGEIQ